MKLNSHRNCGCRGEEKKKISPDYIIPCNSSNGLVHTFCMTTSCTTFPAEQERYTVLICQSAM